VKSVAVTWVTLACFATALVADAQASATRNPTRSEARALKNAERGRHHPKGTRILAMRVAGSSGQYAAVIWRVSLSKASAARGPKIIGGTDFFNGGPHHYKPSKPRPDLRPRYFDIHATITGGQTASYHLPAAPPGGSCEIPQIDYRITSTETFTTNVDHVRLPGSTKRKGVTSSYNGSWNVTRNTAACGLTPASVSHCSLSETLTDKGSRSPDNLRIQGLEIDAFAAALFEPRGSTVKQDCAAGANPGYAELAGANLGGAVTLTQSELDGGSAITKRLGDSGFLKGLSVAHKCSGSTCDGPPSCANDTSTAAGTTCSSRYTVTTGYMQIFPRGF
jgi:hypothetical protein